MANYNLTNQTISSSFQQLLQKDTDTGNLVDGVGNVVDELIVTASYSVTASYAENVVDPTWDNITNKPTVVSGSSQIDYPLISNIPSGIVSSSTQVEELLPSGVVSGSSQVSYPELSNIPSGIVSSSSQVVLEDTTYTDNGDDSFLMTDGAGNLSFQYVQSVYETIRNTSGAPLAKGTPVYISGSTGDNGNAYPSIASNPLTMPATYVAGEDLGIGETGLALVSGKVEGVDTSGYPAGTMIYVGEGGGYSDQRPSGSNSVVQLLGVVQKEGVGGQGVLINQLEAVLPNIQEGYAWVGDSGNQPIQVSTASWDAHSDLTSLNSFTASQELYNTGINEYTASNDNKVNSLIAETSSYAVKNESNTFTETNVFDDLAVDGTSNSTANIFRINDGQNLTMVSRGWDLFPGSPYRTFFYKSVDISGSLNVQDTVIANEVTATTFTGSFIGDGSQLTGIIHPTGSFATTGSNTFVGNQIISGNLEMAPNTAIVAQTIDAQEIGVPLLLVDELEPNNGTDIAIASGNLTFAGVGQVINNPNGTLEVSEVATTALLTDGIEPNNSLTVNLNGNTIVSGNLEMAPNTALISRVLDVTQEMAAPLILVDELEPNNGTDIAIASGNLTFAGTGQQLINENGAVVANAVEGISEMATPLFLVDDIEPNTGDTISLLGKTNITGNTIALVGNGPNPSEISITYQNPNAGGVPGGLNIGADNLNNTITKVEFQAGTMQFGTGGTNQNVAFGSGTSTSGLNFAISGSSNAFNINTGNYRASFAPEVIATFSNVMQMVPQDPLPTGEIGQLTVSGSNLYFHDNTQWRQVSLV